MSSKFVADKISSMTDENGNLIVCLTASGYARTSARMAVNELKNSEKELAVEIKPYKSARTLRQNSMLWALIEKIAKEESGYARKVETTEVYCDILEEANCAYTWVLAASDEDLKNSYRAVRKLGEREVVNKDGEIITLNIYKCYKGSSKYNISEMTDLIECALDICAELGISDSEVELARRTYGV